MAKYVVDPSVVLAWLRGGHDVPQNDEVLAPTLLRSQVLGALYRDVRDGRSTEAEALDRLARFARMKIRYLGDKVLRRKAWDVAAQLDWDVTENAEYVALTILQADALVTHDEALAAEANRLVATANPQDLR